MLLNESDVASNNSPINTKNSIMEKGQSRELNTLVNISESCFSYSLKKEIRLRSKALCLKTFRFILDLTLEILDS